MKWPFKEIKSIAALGLALWLLGVGLGWSDDQQAQPKTPPPDGIPKVGDTLIITWELMRFHSEPDFISPVVGTVGLDDRVEVLEVSGDWVKVKSLNGRDVGQAGWLPIKMFVRAKSLDQEALLSGKPVRQPGQIEVALGVKAERAPSANSVEESLRELGENKRIRGEQVLLRDPDFNSPAVIKVPKDTKLKVLKRQGDWFEVEYQGKTGWLYRKAFWVSW